MDWYANKKAVITGGSSGIGKATALLLAARGADLCLIARDRRHLEDTLEEVRSQARKDSPAQKIIAVICDVTDRARMNTVAPSIVNDLGGGIDILINCAGTTYPAYVDKTPDVVWDSMISVNYMGTVNAIRAFLPWFMKQKQGHIANVSSVAGYMGVFGYAAYAGAKFAVVGLSESLRQDLLPYGIGVSVLYPPDTDTPLWHEENKVKPPETKALSGTIKVMQPGRIGQALLDGIARKRFAIVPGAMNRFTWFMNRHFPSIVWMIVSADLRKYWRNHPTDSQGVPARPRPD